MATPMYPGCNRCGYSVADLTMPDLDGFGLADEFKLTLREEHPVIIISSWDIILDEPQAIEW